MSQKLAVALGLAICSLPAHGAETQFQRLKRLAIRPLYPTLTQPPSTRIKDGLWKEENEYGVVRYTNGEKLTNEKINSAKQAEAQPDPSKAADPAAVPLSSSSIAQTDKPSVDSPTASASWKKSLAPGTAMAWNRIEVPSPSVALSSRPSPNSSIRDANGDPENLGQIPGLPVRVMASTGIASNQLPSRTSPNSSIRDVNGNPENLGQVPTLPAHETASTSVASNQIRSRTMPDIAIRSTGGDPEIYRDAPGSPPREMMKTGVDFTALRARLVPDAALRPRVMTDSRPAATPPVAPTKAAPAPDVEKVNVSFVRHSLPDLIDLLQNGPSARFRARIADELGRRGLEAAQAIPALSAALNDPSSLVKASAALAIGNIGGDTVGVQPLLAALLLDKNPDVKMSAETALSRLGNSIHNMQHER